MLLNLKQIVGGDDIWVIRALVYSHVDWLTCSLGRLVIEAHVSCCFSVLQDYDLTRKKIFFYFVIRFYLAVIYDLPLVEILWDIAIIPLKHLIRILPPPWTIWPIITRLMNPHLLIKTEVLRNMYISIILLIIKYDMIIIHHRLAILAVSIPRQYVPNHPLYGRCLN